MRILVNPTIRRLFLQIGLSVLGFSLLASLGAGLRRPFPALWVLVCGAGMGALILAALYRYFQQQDRVMEDAVTQIHAYLSGDSGARISCDDEGELNRLFHEVNSLVTILNAHAENESNAKTFLKDTISNISHQLKTPLAALNIYNGILQAEAEEHPAIRQFTDLSEQELDRIEGLVQNLLKVAKWDSGTIVLQKAEENLSEVMACIQRHFAYQARQQEKKLIFSGDDTVKLLCDRGWLMEAVGNLVKNALDHTGAGDTIQVAWNSFGSIVRVTIQDSGSGIAPEDLPHIFKRSYRSRFSQGTQGVGLGLPLAKAIVEAHSGTIEVDSAVGSGTRFTIHFLVPTKL